MVLQFETVVRDHSKDHNGDRAYLSRTRSPSSYTTLPDSTRRSDRYAVEVGSDDALALGDLRRRVEVDSCGGPVRPEGPRRCRKESTVLAVGSRPPGLEDCGCPEQGHPQRLCLTPDGLGPQRRLDAEHRLLGQAALDRRRRIPVVVARDVAVATAGPDQADRGLGEYFWSRSDLRSNEEGPNVCSGRASKRKNCTRRAVPVGIAEQLVADCYRDIAITEEQYAALAVQVEAAFDERLASRSQELAELTASRKRLQDESDKLLAAHFADAIDLGTLKRHQDRIRTGLADIDRRLASEHDYHGGSRKQLSTALSLLVDCATLYARTDEHGSGWRTKP